MVGWRMFRLAADAGQTVLGSCFFPAILPPSGDGIVWAAGPPGLHCCAELADVYLVVELGRAEIWWKMTERAALARVSTLGALARDPDYPPAIRVPALRIRELWIPETAACVSAELAERYRCPVWLGSAELLAA